MSSPEPGATVGGRAEIAAAVPNIPDGDPLPPCRYDGLAATGSDDNAPYRVFHGRVRSAEGDTRSSTVPY